MNLSSVPPPVWITPLITPRYSPMCDTSASGSIPSAMAVKSATSEKNRVSVARLPPNRASVALVTKVFDDISRDEISERSEGSISFPISKRGEQSHLLNPAGRSGLP